MPTPRTSLLLPTLVLALPSCVTLDESAWTLRFSREAYAGGGASWLDVIGSGAESLDHIGAETAFVAAGVVLVFAALPLLVDVVCLPVALPRDLMFDASF